MLRVLALCSIAACMSKPTVSGRVTYQEGPPPPEQPNKTLETVNEVIVGLFDATGVEINSARPDLVGSRFTFDDVDNGTYHLEVTGYHSSGDYDIFADQLGNNATEPFEVTGDVDVGDLLLVWQPQY